MQTIIFTPPTCSLFPVSHDVNKIVTWADKLGLYSRFTNEKNPEPRTWLVLMTTGFLTRRVRPCVSLSLARVGREGGRVWVNEFILFSTKFQLISIFSYWISNMGDDHHRWFGVNNVHIPCNGYVPNPLVVSTPQSFPHSWLITGFVTRLARRVSHVVEELPILPEHLDSSVHSFQTVFPYKMMFV